MTLVDGVCVGCKALSERLSSVPGCSATDGTRSESAYGEEAA